MNSATAATQQAPPPSTWATACGSAQLGLDKVVVELAQPRREDTTPAGKPIVYTPDSSGRYTPVILIHGWTGSSTHGPDGAFSHRIDLTANRLGTVRTTRSLIGQLQSLPGAAVFTFDYHPYSARWVDDEHLGPDLGKVIDCLYRVSGQKVILVGHSMGGLVARFAATHPGTTGPDRSGEISTVVTFGTPETGSIAAMLAAGALDGGSTVNGHAAVLRMILAACGALSSQEIETDSMCDKLIPPLRAFASSAGIALRAGSRELASLKPWPKSIFVDALAGQTSFQVPTLSWFTVPLATTAVATGDVIVTAGSALQGADQTKTVSCSFRVAPSPTAGELLALSFGLISKTDIPDVPLKAFNGACFHSSLMRSIELSNEALGAVADDLAARQPVTAASLGSAPVPAACTHPAGRLKNGELPGIPQGEGTMGLAWVIFNLPADKFLALGDLDGRGGADAAATLWCNAGGVSWPELIAFYAPGPRLLGSVDLGDINLPGHTGGENAGVQQLRYDRGNVIAEWMTQNDGDPAAISSMDYTATLHWNGSKIVVSRLTATTERETVNRFLTALRNGDTPAAAQLTAPDVTAEAMNQFARYPEALINTAPVCHGVLDQLPPSAQGLSVSELMGRVDRICLIPTDHEAEHYIALGLKHSSFKQWQISALAII